MSIAVAVLAAAVVLGATSCTRQNADFKKAPEPDYYQKVTGDSSEEGRSRWDAVMDSGEYVYGREPADFLKSHLHLLPVGMALDIAMGEGRNAVFLAKKGFQVTGVDYSEVAIRKAHRLARENGVTVQSVMADLARYQIRPNHYDVILNIDYLQKDLVPQIKRGLKKGGVLVFESRTVEQLKNPSAHSFPREYLLELGELKKLFQDLEILVYRETNDGKNAFASLIARKL